MATDQTSHDRGERPHVPLEDHDGGDAQVCPPRAEDLRDLGDRAYKKEGRLLDRLNGQRSPELTRLLTDTSGIVRHPHLLTDQDSTTRSLPLERGHIDLVPLC